MFCQNCGQKLPETAKFCENCGAPVEKATPTKPMTAGGSGDIRLCPDGKYRWYYEYPMLKNPVILITIWKVMLIAGLAPALLVLFTSLSDGVLSALRAFITVYGIIIGIVFVLSCIAYFIVAATYGFKYIVLFEMDEDGVRHAQQEKQFKKAQAIGWLTALAGASRGDPGTTGAGLLAASKQSMTSVFKNVSTVIGQKSKNTIRVNQRLAKNQVYAKSEDYDFVWEYITSRCKKAKIK